MNALAYICLTYQMLTLEKNISTYKTGDRKYLTPEAEIEEQLAWIRRIGVHVPIEFNIFSLKMTLCEEYLFRSWKLLLLPVHRRLQIIVLQTQIYHIFTLIWIVLKWNNPITYVWLHREEVICISLPKARFPNHTSAVIVIDYPSHRALFLKANTACHYWPHWSNNVLLIQHDVILQYVEISSSLKKISSASPPCLLSYV